MDRDTAVTRIQDGLGFRTDLSAKIILRLQEAQRKFEQGKTLPWFLQTQHSDTLVTGGNYIAFPSDYIRDAENYTPYYYDSDNKVVHLTRKTLLASDLAYPNQGASERHVPLVYVTYNDHEQPTLQGWYFLPPFADQDYTMYMPCYIKDDVLTTNIENAWLANVPELLIGEAGMRLAGDLRDGDAMQIFKTMRDDAWDAVFRETIWREDQNRKSHIGEDL